MQDEAHSFSPREEVGETDEGEAGEAEERSLGGDPWCGLFSLSLVPQMTTVSTSTASTQPRRPTRSPLAQLAGITSSCSSSSIHKPWHSLPSVVTWTTKLAAKRPVTSVASGLPQLEHLQGRAEGEESGEGGRETGGSGEGGREEWGGTTTSSTRTGPTAKRGKDSNSVGQEHLLDVLEEEAFSEETLQASLTYQDDAGNLLHAPRTRRRAEVADPEGGSRGNEEKQARSREVHTHTHTDTHTDTHTCTP